MSRHDCVDPFADRGPEWRQVDGIEVRNDGHAVAMMQADGRSLPIRFTFDEGKIARVEVL